MEGGGDIGRKVRVIGWVWNEAYLQRKHRIRRTRDVIKEGQSQKWCNKGDKKLLIKDIKNAIFFEKGYEKVLERRERVEVNCKVKQL